MRACLRARMRAMLCSLLQDRSLAIPQLLCYSVTQILALQATLRLGKICQDLKHAIYLLGNDADLSARKENILLSLFHDFKVIFDAFVVQSAPSESHTCVLPKRISGYAGDPD